MTLALEMDREDWRRLHAYLSAANKVKQLVEAADLAGKQQVSIKQSDVEHFASTKLPPDFWIKLGSLIGSKLSGDDE